MSHVAVAYIFPFHMMNSRKAHVVCEYLFHLLLDVTKRPMSPWIKRKMPCHPEGFRGFRGSIHVLSTVASGVGLEVSMWVGGRSHVACRFQEISMSHVAVAFFPPCHMMNSRKAHVACHYIFQLLFDVTKRPMSPWIKREMSCHPESFRGFRGLIHMLSTVGCGVGLQVSMWVGGWSHVAC